jgi:hypothetical protein
MSDHKLCKIHGCYEDHHARDHICSTCGGIAHGSVECGGQTLMNQHLNKHQLHAIDIAKSQFDKYDRKICISIYAGMGCFWYAKRNSLHGAISLFFMHQNDDGRYSETDKREQLYLFVDGYYRLRDQF